MRRIGGLVLVLALLGAACGDDDSDSEQVSSEAQGAEQDENAPEPEAEEPAPEVEEPEEESEPEPEPEPDESEDDTATASGDSGSDWCDAVRSADDGGDSPLDFDLTASPAELGEQLESNLDLIRSWADRAPSEIEDDVDVLVDTYATFVELGSAADWDIAALASDPEFTAAFDDPAIEQAADNIDAYTRDVCGVDLGGGSAGEPAPNEPPEIEVGSGDLVGTFLALFGLPSSFVTEEQASCMNDELTSTYPDGVPEDFALTPDVIDAFDTAAENCGITG